MLLYMYVNDAVEHLNIHSKFITSYTIMAIAIMENEMQCIISNNMILMCSFN